MVTDRTICDNCDQFLNTTVLFYNNPKAHTYWLLELEPYGELTIYPNNKNPIQDSSLGIITKRFENEIILGTALIGSDLYLMSNNRVFIMKLRDTHTDVSRPGKYSGTTGGFEFKGKPHFVINNTVYEYNKYNKKMQKKVCVEVNTNSF